MLIPPIAYIQNPKEGKVEPWKEIRVKSVEVKNFGAARSKRNLGQNLIGKILGNFSLISGTKTQR